MPFTSTGFAEGKGKGMAQEIRQTLSAQWLNELTSLHLLCSVHTGLMSLFSNPQYWCQDPTAHVKAP